MGHFLDRLTYFTRTREPFAGGHGEVRRENREWEEGYRQRWQHDKIVRSTHGVNCTGSCSWKIYVKGGVVTWETQQTDYPRTRPDMPNHEPRGCSRGASYSWYLYSASRLKYPMVRGQLIRAWREARRTLDPVEAWASIADDPDRARAYKSLRGRGGFVRSSWDEVAEIIAAANIHTIKTYGPDRVVGFSPIPAMSMVSYASGARYLSLIGGTLLSFYDWYCDLPPSSPQTWGEQTDVPESADWYNSGFIIAWGSNVPQTRTPDAHFFVEARYNGTKVVAITPDYSEVAKLSDLWLHPKQGTDAALAMAMGHVILREFFLDRQVPYFENYCRRYTDMPMLVRLVRQGDRWVPDRYVRASDFPSGLGQTGHPEWKTVAVDEISGAFVSPRGSIGYRWPQEGDVAGKWNLEEKDGVSEREVRLALSLIHNRDEALPVAFPYFGNQPHERFAGNDQGRNVLVRHVPARRVALAEGEACVATVFDLLCGQYGLDRGLGGEGTRSFDDNLPYTPAWQEQITGSTSPELAAVREMLRQRAVALGLLSSEAEARELSAGIEALLDREVATPSPTEDECRRFYAAHPEMFRSGDLVFVRHILFQVTPGSPIDLIRGQAEQTLAQVVAAPDEFEACALTLSNCPSGRQGGNLGQIGRGDTAPEFEQALFVDRWIGILPRLVKTRHGFHIVSIDRRVEGRVLPFEVVHERIAERLRQHVQEVALKQYVRLLAGEADVEGVELDAALTPLVQ